MQPVWTAVFMQLRDASMTPGLLSYLHWLKPIDDSHEGEALSSASAQSAELVE
jgi:hypothetical protein